MSSVWIDLFDVRARYTLDVNDLGRFTTTLSATYNTKYEYADGGARVDALGRQNARTGVVAPVPELKSQLRLAWMRDSQSASLTYSYQDSVVFDDTVNNLLTGVPAPSDGMVRHWSIANAQYTHVLDQFFDSEITLSAGINNIFDRLPQRLPVLGGFESRLHSPWGRQFWASVEWQPF